MTNYDFNLIPPQGNRPLTNPSLLLNRPIELYKNDFVKNAPKFVAGEELCNAINTSIAVGEPLLLTGEPGTGKTQTAYYVAFQLGVNCFHYQAKSDSTAQDLLYHFDMIRYYRDSHFYNNEIKSDIKSNDKNKYIEKRALWMAIEEGNKREFPQVLLIDEIDKAPRDFPNDLLHELNQMEFLIKENSIKIKAPVKSRPLVFITSNSERHLPDPFLRRCIYHHIEFTEEILRMAIENRRYEFKNLSPKFLDLAIERFIALREKNLRKKPSTSECIVWLQVLSIASKKDPETIEHLLSEELSQIPYLGALLKDYRDWDELP